MKVQQDRDIMATLRSLTNEENATLRGKLKTEGCWQAFAYAMIAGVPVQMDGHHRKAICMDEKIGFEWRLIETVTTKDQAISWVKSNQVGRRNATPEELTTLREERRERVAAAHDQGQSTRTIAAAEGVSQPTILRDLATKSVENGVSPECTSGNNGTVTGADGKNYAASKPKVLCQRCQKGEPVKGCPACKDLRGTSGTKGGTRAAPSSNGQQEAPKDAFGVELPKHTRAAYGDPWMQSAIDFLAEFGEKFRKERLADGLRKRAKYYPFIDEKDFRDGVGFVIDYLDRLLDHLKDGRPAAVCQKCGGDRCAACKMSGLVPRKLYEKGEKVAR